MLSVPVLACGLHFGLNHYWKYNGSCTARRSTCLLWPTVALQNRKTPKAGGQELWMRAFPRNKKDLKSHRTGETAERNPKEEWIQNKTGFLQSLVLTCVSRFVSSKIWMLHKHLYTSLYYPSVNCIDLEVFIDGPRGCQQADILFSSSTRQEPPEQAYSKGFGKDVISSAWSEAHVRGHMSKPAECKAVQCTVLFAFFVELP